MPTLVSSVPQDALALAEAAGWSLDAALEAAVRYGRRRLVSQAVEGALGAAEVEARFAALRELANGS